MQPVGDAKLHIAGPFCWAALVLSTYVACAGSDRRAGGSRDAAGRQNADALLEDCSQDSGAAVRISDDSIGPLPLGATMQSLRATCRAARDTVRYGESSSYPGVVFPFHGLSVVAFQYEDSLHLDEPADTWIVRGANGLLPNGVRTTATWAELRKAYGPGRGGGDLGLAVMFCTHPNLFLELDASPDSVRHDRPTDLSRIPNNARITEILIERTPPWSC